MIAANHNAVPSPRSELPITFVGLASGLISALYLASGGRSFLTSFAFYWLSQLCVPVILLLFRPRWAVVGGAACAMALYVAGFASWVMSIHDPDSANAWVIYLLTLPGALIGGIVAVFWPGRRASLPPVKVATLVAGVVVIGVAINLGVVIRYLMS